MEIKFSISLSWPKLKKKFYCTEYLNWFQIMQFFPILDQMADYSIINVRCEVGS